MTRLKKIVGLALYVVRPELLIVAWAITWPFLAQWIW